MIVLRFFFVLALTLNLTLGFLGCSDDSTPIVAELTAPVDLDEDLDGDGNPLTVDSGDPVHLRLRITDSKTDEEITNAITNLVWSSTLNDATFNITGNRTATVVFPYVSDVIIGATVTLGDGRSDETNLLTIAVTSGY